MSLCKGQTSFVANKEKDLIAEAQRKITSLQKYMSCIKDCGDDPLKRRKAIELALGLFESRDAEVQDHQGKIYSIEDFLNNLIIFYSDKDNQISYKIINVSKFNPLDRYQDSFIEVEEEILTFNAVIRTQKIISFDLKNQGQINDLKIRNISLKE